MKKFISKFKIPTLLGLGVIFVGIGAGVFLVMREQTFLTSAAPGQTPSHITVTNVGDSSVVISWQTSNPSLGFVTYGQGDPSEQTTLDDRDIKVPQTHLMHYSTIKNLLPKTTYQYKVVSGKITSPVSKFTTASTTDAQNTFSPIIGSIVEGSSPINEGIAYLSMSNAAVQSSLIKTSGNFLIPLSKIRQSNLSDVYSLSSDTEAKITVVAPNGQSTIIFQLKDAGTTLPGIKLGENTDLTIVPIPSPNPVSTLDIKIYDLNNDGKVNASDYSIALKNKDKKVSSIRKDLNIDNVIDQKYLDDMTNKQIN